MKYQDQPYHHSFMIIPDEMIVSHLNEYMEVKLPRFTLFHSQSMACTAVSDGLNQLIVLGYLLDIRDGNKSMEVILNDLIQATDFEKELEYLNGRYIIICVRASNIEFYSDATNLLPANYHRETGSFASHDMLLAEILTDNAIELTRRPLRKTNDLDFTRYEEIWKVNPSIKYRLNSFQAERIYPRLEQVKQSVDEAFTAMKPYLDQQNIWLERFNGDIFLSMTAGMDSRTSAAIAHRLHKRIEFLTYMTPRKLLATPMARKIYQIDSEVVRDMKENMGWNHSIINLGDYDVSSADLPYFKEILNSKHSHRLAQYFRDKGYNKALHIKSTVFGVGKADFDKTLDNITDTLSDYKKVMTHYQKDFKKYYNIDEEIDAYFKRNLVTENVTKNRHYFELFHLESRLGNWHSVLTSETDPETEEFIYLNARKMIDLFTSIPIQDMRKHRLHKRIVKEYWGVLNYFGVNRTETLWDDVNKHDGEIIRLKDVWVNYESEMHVEADGDELIIHPAPTRLSAFENYDVYLRNSQQDTAHLRLRSTYSKPAGRGKIFVTLKSERYYERYDILALNEGIDIEVKDSQLKISIEYIKSFSEDSWKHAGKLIIS